MTVTDDQWCNYGWQTEALPLGASPDRGAILQGSVGLTMVQVVHLWASELGGPHNFTGGRGGQKRI